VHDLQELSEGVNRGNVAGFWEFSIVMSLVNNSLFYFNKNNKFTVYRMQ